MLWWALAFFILAILAAILGFGGIASAIAGIAQIIFYLALALFVVALIMSLVRESPSSTSTV